MQGIASANHDEAKLNMDRVNNGIAFLRWASVMRDKGFRCDAEVVSVLLDRLLAH